MSPVTKKHQQLILLEPEGAKLLEELAAETRVPKQVLLREAVADLLSKHNKGVMTQTYVRLRGALKAARQQLSTYRRDLVQRKAGVTPIQNCDRAIDWIDLARASIGDAASGAKKMTVVYRFQVWDQNMGENVWAPRKATIEAIKRVNGTEDMSTETPVDESEVDGNGFHPPKTR
jgi:ribbon-helix-helix protein